MELKKKLREFCPIAIITNIAQQLPTYLIRIFVVHFHIIILHCKSVVLVAEFSAT